MAALTVDFRKTQWTNTSRWHGSPNHHWLWKLHTGLQATWILFLSTLPPDSGTLISKWNPQFTLIWKEGFGRLTSSPVLFLFSPGKMLLMLFLVQKWLGSLFLKMSERSDSWCTDSSFSSLLVKRSQVFELALKACGHPCCLCTFSCPISSFQSNLHLKCFDTALLEQPPLSVMTLCDLPSLWRCQWSSSGSLPSQQCSPLLWFQRTRDTQNLYCMDVHLFNSNVNILIFWDTDFWL